MNKFNPGDKVIYKKGEDYFIVKVESQNASDFKGNVLETNCEIKYSHTKVSDRILGWDTKQFKLYENSAILVNTLLVQLDKLQEQYEI